MTNASEGNSKTATPKYPKVKVRLSGEDGNSYGIIARCSRAAKKAKVSIEEIAAFQAEATNGNYDHLLRTCMTWFDVN